MENNRPEISVLVPVYNTEEKHLRECIESILNQTFKLEYLTSDYRDKKLLYTLFTKKKISFFNKVKASIFIFLYY